MKENRLCSLIFTLCLILLNSALSPLYASSSEQKLSYNKPNKNTTNSHTKNSQTTSEEIVRKSYETFIESWMAKLDKVSQHNSNNINFIKNGDLYVGQFITYGPEKEFWIKKTNEKPTTHVGYLKYKQKVHEKRGVSLSEAKNCQPYLIQESNVTEIFRYTNGKWIY